MKHSTCIAYAIVLLLNGLPGLVWSQQQEAEQDSLIIKVVLDTVLIKKK